jgi:hypothetical protein
MAHFGSPLDGGPIDQKRVQIGGYLESLSKKYR